VGTDIKKRDVRVTVLACDDYDFDNLCNEKTVIFILATCGQGELPSNCKDFYASITAMEDNPEWLKDVNIGVFGMGDSHYVYFNSVATKFDDELRKKGAQMVVDVGLGDDQDPEKYESVFEEWGPTLFTKLELPEAQRILLASQYSAEILSNDTGEYEVSTDVILPAGAKLVPVVENRLLTPVTYDRDTRHYEFEVSEAGMSYEVGDSLGIYPANDSSKVSSFLSWYGLNENDIIRLTDDAGEANASALPEYVSVKQLFQQVLDVFGRPKRRFYELLSLVATDETEKSELEHVLNRDEDDRAYQYNVSNTLTHADLLERYQSARPSIGHMIDFIPRIKPRLYSIASSPNEQPNEIALCIVVDDWTTPDTAEYRRGLCSDFLTYQSRDSDNPQDFVVAKVNAGVVAMPPTHSTPMVMAGLGTGLAPLRGMVRDRMFTQASGQSVGPMALYFGARHRASEFLYESEWEQFHDSGRGPLQHLRCAFSRDQPEKVYIQDKIKEDSDMIYDYLVNQKGYFYACGSSAVQDLKKYVAECIAEGGKMSIEEGEQYVTQMMIEGRYCIESW
jgi:sulfite reductase alpha subunit-like flavoprotein